MWSTYKRMSSGRWAAPHSSDKRDSLAERGEGREGSCNTNEGVESKTFILEQII